MVDGTADAVAGLRGLGEHVASAERHEDDVADVTAGEVDRGHRHRRHGQAAQRDVVEALGQEAQGLRHPRHVLGEVGAWVDEEGKGAGLAHGLSSGVGPGSPGV